MIVRVFPQFLSLSAVGFFLAVSWLTDGHQAHAATVGKLPPFVLPDCLAVLDDDPTDVDDYVSSHDIVGSERAVRHCRAVAEAFGGNAAGGATQLDELAHKAATRHPETDDDSPEERAATAADAARAWSAAGAFDRALASSAYGLELARESVDLHLLRDRSLLQLNRPAEALQDLSRLAANPVMAAETHRLKARAEMQTGDFNAASRDIDITLEKSPDDAAAHLERGIIRHRLNNVEGARADWEQVIALAPDSHEADLARQDLDVLASDPDALPPSTTTVQQLPLSTASSH